MRERIPNYPRTHSLSGTGDLCIREVKYHLYEDPTNGIVLNEASSIIMKGTTCTSLNLELPIGIENTLLDFRRNEIVIKNKFPSKNFKLLQIHFYPPHLDQDANELNRLSTVEVFKCIYNGLPALKNFLSIYINTNLPKNKELILVGQTNQRMMNFAIKRLGFKLIPEIGYIYIPYNEIELVNLDKFKNLINT